MRLEAVRTESQPSKSTVQLLQPKPDSDHQAEAGGHGDEEEEEEEDPHVGSSVRLQGDDTELTSSPGRAQLLRHSPQLLSGQYIRFYSKEIYINIANFLSRNFLKVV